MPKTFNPGDYLQYHSIGKNDTTEIQPFALNAGFAGISVDMMWSLVETSQGVYDFSNAQAYLDWGSVNDKQVIFMWSDRDFGGGTPEENRTVPQYVKNAGKVTLYPNGKGSVANVWETGVVNWKIAALQAFCGHFDSHPNFEALILQETALGGINPNNTAGFSFGAYLTEIKRIHTELAPHVPNTSVVHYAHHALGGPVTDVIRELAQQMLDLNLGGLGRPDMAPWRDEEPYHVWKEYRDEIVVVSGGDTSQYEQPNSSYYTDMDDLINQIYDHSITEIGAQYRLWRSSFWSKKVSGEPYTSDYLAAVKTLIENPAKVTNQTSPTVVGGTGPTPPAPSPFLCVGGLLTNADFSSGATGWTAVADGTTAVESEEYHISGTVATSPYNELYQSGLSVTSGDTIYVTFTARNDDAANPNLTIEMIQHSTPFANLGLTQAFATTASNAEYSTTFVVNATEADARLLFRFATGDFYIDNVCVRVIQTSRVRKRKLRQGVGLGIKPGF